MSDPFLDPLGRVQPGVLSNIAPGNVYTTGLQAGGEFSSPTVTQATSNSTDVTINKLKDKFNMFGVVTNTSTGAFAVNNSNVSTSSVVFISQNQPNLNMAVSAIAVGSFTISFNNFSGTDTAAAPEIRFWVIN